MSRLALITGASSGIGMAYAERLAADGYDLIAVGRRSDRLEALAASLSRVSVELLAADLATDEGVDAVAELCASRPLTMLVNNAGVAHYMPLAELPAEKARELVHVKVLAPTMLTRAALPGMLSRGEGTIVNVAGMIAFSGPAPASQMPRRAVYAGTLAHIVAMTQALHAELEDTRSSSRWSAPASSPPSSTSARAWISRRCRGCPRPTSSPPRCADSSSGRSCALPASRTRACSSRCPGPTWPRSAGRARSSPRATGRARRGSFRAMRSDLAIGQGALDGKGIFADRDFLPGEEVVSFHLRELTLAEFRDLPETDQLLFVHSYGGRRFLYPTPVRYANHSDQPTVREDFERSRFIALRRISRGEPITIDATRETDRELATFMEAFRRAVATEDDTALAELIADTASVWLPDRARRGAARVGRALREFHHDDRQILSHDLEWIVGRHRWEAVCFFGITDRAAARHWHATVMLQVIDGNWQLVYAHVGRADAVEPLA